MPEFVPGLELSRALYRDAVAPLLASAAPGLRYSAALLGPGSEVLGYDTARSTDHDWGPRLQLFLTGDDHRRSGAHLTTLLGERLPPSVLGHPTLGVEVAGLGTWLTARLGFDPRRPVRTEDWLAVPTQVLASVTAGAVFHDGLGELTAARERLAWYPPDVWRYVLACQWQRIAEEEPFPGRCSEVGDELGAAIVTARVVRDIVRLHLLQRRRYPPYSKWLGTAFGALPGAAGLGDTLRGALAASSPAGREDAVAAALEHVAAVQNELALAPAVDPTTRPFYDRPFRVLRAERFAEALCASITDPALRRLPLVGAIDQWVDSTAALGRVDGVRRAQEGMTD